MPSAPAPISPSRPSAPAASLRRAGPVRRALVEAPADVAHVPALRHQVAVLLHTWHVPREAVADAELVVTELTANAAAAAADEPGAASEGVGVRVAADASGVCLAVTDHAPATPPAPRPQMSGPQAESGRGLVLVDALAERWGTLPRPAGPGKTVWCRIPVAGAAAPAAA